MRHIIKTGFVLALLVSGSTAQSEPKLVDAFGRLPCGHMMAVLDGVVGEWFGERDHRIVIVYRGHRFRKNVKQGKNGAETIELRPAHPDDGLYWARGISKYLVDFVASRKLDDQIDVLKRQISLVDAGYDEDISAEIWFLPPGKELPRPEPKLKRADIKFGAPRPFRTPSYISCYASYDETK